jgi:hypothetical protein
MPDALPLIPPPGHGRAVPLGPATVAPADWDPSHIHFSDVLSALNPLQYVPVVGMIYREITGDEVHPALRVAVAAVTSVFFGPVGLAATMLTVAATEVAQNRPHMPDALWAGASAAYRRAARTA